MADRKDLETNGNVTAPPTETPASSVGKTLAAMALADSIKEGKVIEIPSLDITITKEDIQERNKELSHKEPPHEKLSHEKLPRKFFLLRRLRNLLLWYRS